MSDIPIELQHIRDAILSQDNRATSHPMFCVQVKCRIGPINMEHVYNNNIMIHSRSDHFTYYPEHEEHAGLLAMHLAGTLDDDYEVAGFTEHWETVCVCFTEEGCKAHLELNGHNYNHTHGTRIYVDSFYRNPEMIALRKFLRGDDKDC